MKKTIIISIIILLVAFVLYFVFSIYGNPLGFAKAKPRIEEYKTDMKDVNFELFEESKIGFDFKMNSYYRKYTFKTQPLLSFNISCFRVDCTDTYSFDFIEGTNALAILANRIRDSKFGDFNTLYPDYGYLMLEPIKPLNELGNYKDLFMNNSDVDSLPIFKVSIMFVESSFSDSSIIVHLADVFNYMESKGYEPEYLDVTIFLKNEEDYKEVTNVTKELAKDNKKMFEYINTFETKNNAK